jgi:hypothetical protein
VSSSGLFIINQSSVEINNIATGYFHPEMGTHAEICRIALKEPLHAHRMVFAAAGCQACFAGRHP